jgi:hypothetical protein
MEFMPMAACAEPTQVFFVLLQSLDLQEHSQDFRVEILTFFLVLPANITNASTSVFHGCSAVITPFQNHIQLCFLHLLPSLDVRTRHTRK